LREIAAIAPAQLKLTEIGTVNGLPLRPLGDAPSARA